MPCTFRTCYDTILWPLTVSAVDLSAPSRLKPAVKTNDSAWAVRLELRCARDVTFPGLKLDKLRFYLDGDSGLVNILYEASVQPAQSHCCARPYRGIAASAGDSSGVGAEGRRLRRRRRYGFLSLIDISRAIGC